MGIITLLLVVHRTKSTSMSMLNSQKGKKQLSTVKTYNIVSLYLMMEELS